MTHDTNWRTAAPLVLLATAAGCWALDEDADALSGALTDAGIRSEPAIWDDPEVRWDEADAVVVRSTWDYPLRRDEFLAWAERVAGVTTLMNPPGILRWNTDKLYLAELADRGIPVVPTSFIERGQHDAAGLITACMEHSGTEHGGTEHGGTEQRGTEHGGTVVVKPSVSAGSRDTARFDAHHIPDAVALVERITHGGRTAMVQPYLDSVDTRGETGLVYFDGVFSHGFNKSPLLGTIGEVDHGIFAIETITAQRPSDAHRTLAGEILAVVERRFGTVPTYARIDVLTDRDSTPVLLELELTEPSWFLSTDPGAPQRAVAAISDRLG